MGAASKFNPITASTGKVARRESGTEDDDLNSSNIINDRIEKTL